jgi:hypothetical protein
MSGVGCGVEAPSLPADIPVPAGGASVQDRSSGRQEVPVPPLPDPRRGGGRHREAGQDQCRRFSSLAIVQVTMNMPGTKGLGGHTAPYRGAVRAVRHRGLRARIVSLSLSGLPSSTQQSHAAGLAAAGRGVGCFSEVVPSSLGWLGGGPDIWYRRACKRCSTHYLHRPDGCLNDRRASSCLRPVVGLEPTSQSPHAP